MSPPTAKRLRSDQTNPYQTNWRHVPMLDTQRRDALISAAIAAGKFAPDRREHYRQMYDRDPGGTELVLAALTPGVPPVPVASFNSPHTAELFPDLARGHRHTPRPATA